MTPITSAQTLGAAVRAAKKCINPTQSGLALVAGVGFIITLKGGKATVRRGE